ncbi:MAG: biotin carboxylase N-terminal domain-containing protein [Alphaproteobacteria bacterium]
MRARPFGKLLIANRGEIACRVMRTARRMGIKTVAVYSEADDRARHVAEADEAVSIGPAPASESYLRIDYIIAAAKQSGSEAVHPGYGFLSENEAFAEACSKAGLVFVGPPASAIKAMASKSAARQLMQAAGVAVVPGYDKAQDDKSLASAVAKIGFPVLIKPTAGGGGKGMRIVAKQSELAEALAGARSEAKRSFGDDQLLIEKYVAKARHIEVQVFGDTHGNVVSLYERDCTLQRRYQKVIEEAPAPTLNAPQREALWEQARTAARAIGYVGAGTVEFIADGEHFYFLEMNTRLQVEHPVTEAITGLDLVEWQLRVASGEKLPLAQSEIRAVGHAIEARVYAEDPDRDLLPSTGKLVGWREPRGARVDSGFREGDSASQYYDPLLAKVIVKAETRSAALAKLDAALADFAIAGVASNISLLRALARDPHVFSSDIDTHFVDRFLARDIGIAAPSEPEIAAACAAVLAREQSMQRELNAASPWHRRDGWMMAGERRRQISFRRGEAVHDAAVIYTRNGLKVEINGRTQAFSVAAIDDYSFDFVLDDHKRRAVMAWAGRDLLLSTGRGTYSLHWIDPFEAEDSTAAGAHSLTAPMSGTVTRLVASPGEKLERGAAILVIESMKMEHLVRAPRAGLLKSIGCMAGDFVQQGVELAEFEAEAEN